MKMDAREPLPIHFMLFALYPIFSLYAENISEIEFSDTYRSIAIIVLGSAAFLFLFQSIIKDRHKASAFVSLCLLLFFSYGHIYSLLKVQTIGDLIIGRHRYLIPFWLLFFLIGAWFVLKKLVNAYKLTRVLNFVSLILLVFPTFIILSHNLHAIQTPLETESSNNDQVKTHTFVSEELLPDIYYIIVDAYARNDILLDQYGFDNSGFYEFLNNHAFYIAEQSTSNYLWTHLSLASSLNMDYIPNIIPGWTQGSKIIMDEYIKNSVVRRNLESRGYSTVGFATGWKTTELFHADYILTPDKPRMEDLKDKGLINPFEGMLLHTTMLKILVDYDAFKNTPAMNFVAQRMLLPFEHQREIILAQFENIKKTPHIPGPKFVFVHIISPHQPYLFGANGEDVEQSGPFTLAQSTGTTEDEDIDRYLAQLTFITKMLEEAIDEVISVSERPVIILLQSDHGPGLNLVWENPETLALRDKMSILNAYYVPQECKPKLYDTVTPVNSFRVIFRCVFGESFQLLEDVTYFGVREFYDIKELYNFDDEQ